MALQAWLDGNWMLPQTQGAVVPNPKTLKETMVSLTPEASVNQIKALQYVLAHACPQTLLSPSSPTSSLQVYSLAGVCRNGQRPPNQDKRDRKWIWRVCSSHHQGRT